mmetsp:Transcript_31358/g.73141  ORF Transcript_31358/g.73141 Transcript_31358/m.73141 type:complete len:252 (-) Transcript_31358:1653-2408(-)
MKTVRGRRIASFHGGSSKPRLSTCSRKRLLMVTTSASLNTPVGRWTTITSGFMANARARPSLACPDVVILHASISSLPCTFDKMSYGNWSLWQILRMRSCPPIFSRDPFKTMLSRAVPGMRLGSSVQCNTRRCEGMKQLPLFASSSSKITFPRILRRVAFPSCGGPMNPYSLPWANSTLTFFKTGGDFGKANVTPLSMIGSSSTTSLVSSVVRAKACFKGVIRLLVTFILASASSSRFMRSVILFSGAKLR